MSQGIGGFLTREKEWLNIFVSSYFGGRITNVSDASASRQGLDIFPAKCISHQSGPFMHHDFAVRTHCGYATALLATVLNTL